MSLTLSSTAVSPTGDPNDRHIEAADVSGGIQRRHPVENFPDDDWEEVLQVNLNTVFQITRDAGESGDLSLFLALN